METNPGVEQNENIRWSDSPWNQSGRINMPGQSHHDHTVLNVDISNYIDSDGAAFSSDTGVTDGSVKGTKSPQPKSENQQVKDCRYPVGLISNHACANFYYFMLVGRVFLCSS